MQQWPLARGKLRKKVLHLLARGQVSRAVKLICSHSLADMYDPQIIDAMQAKYPERGRELPATVTVGQCVDNMRGMRERMMNLELGVSPGFGGKRNEHLLCLAKVWGVQQMGLLETFSIQYLNGKFPPWFHQICESVASFPLFKNGNMKTVMAVLWAHPTPPSHQSWSLRGRCRRSASSTFRCTSLRSTAGTESCQQVPPPWNHPGWLQCRAGVLSWVCLLWHPSWVRWLCKAHVKREGARGAGRGGQGE